MVFANFCQQGRVVANGLEKKSSPKRPDSPGQVAAFKQFIAALTAQTLTAKSYTFKQATTGSPESPQKNLAQEINEANTDGQKAQAQEQRESRHVRHAVTLPPLTREGSGEEPRSSMTH